MPSLPSQKCKHCRKAFIGRIDQLYCGAKCRQAAYRARKAKAAGKSKHSQRATSSKPLSVATCQHCNGSFWAKTARAQFCSVSCRTLYHRALVKAIPAAVGAAFGVPADKALDLLEMREIGKIREYLTCMGFTYRHDRRAWVAE